ncbi:Peroxisomal membrane protein PMP27 [Nowakowskiella sp. JEL0078]|nr:Peroxisomal membrane protein PMP27 [Nowakowskiella sp. JEL0078]
MSSNITVTADHTVKFLSTTVGRDRIYRFAQFFSRYLSWHLQQSGNKDDSSRYANLSVAIGQTRRYYLPLNFEVIAAGRQLEFIRGIQKAVVIKDETIRATTIAKNFFLSLWLTYDFLAWIQSTGFTKFQQIKTITKRSSQFWLLALIASTIGSAYRLRANLTKIEMHRKWHSAAVSNQEKSIKDIEELKKNLDGLVIERNKIAFAATQDALDALIPLSALEYIKIESGYIGLIGAFTSLLGGYTHWTSI